MFFLILQSSQGEILDYVAIKLMVFDTNIVVVQQPQDRSISQAKVGQI